MMFLVVIVVSCHLFPFRAPYTLGLNTKQLLAVFGIVALIVKLSRARSGKIDTSVFVLLLFACLFSLSCYFSVVYNGTYDYNYTTYFGSCLVWLASAYGALTIARYVHGRLDVRLVSNYVIAVCVAQCIIAEAIDQSPIIEAFFQAIVPQRWILENGRMYGIGCMLDPAGTRFAAAMVICSIMIVTLKEKDQKIPLYLYLFSFCIVTIIGNMISRTTTVGSIIGLAVIIIAPILGLYEGGARRSIIKSFFTTLAVIVPLSIILYSHNEAFHDSIRFGFEGFFSIAEKGYWETNSNNTLETMYVWPDNIKTWLLGDGYFLGAQSDKYYVGDDIGFFYMNTDVGFCRFIFYFGIIGLVLFIIYFAKATQLCIRKYPGYALLFILLFFVELIIWLKVSTDIFLVFALYLAIGVHDDLDIINSKSISTLTVS